MPFIRILSVNRSSPDPGSVYVIVIRGVFISIPEPSIGWRIFRSGGVVSILKYEETSEVFPALSLSVR